MRAPPKHITILGGGLSGLSTAYHLSRALPASTKISLVEGTSRVGGWIDSQKHELGFKDKEGNVREGVVGIETGPRSIRPRGSRGAASMLKMVSVSLWHVGEEPIIQDVLQSADTRSRRGLY